MLDDGYEAVVLSDYAKGVLDRAALPPADRAVQASAGSPSSSTPRASQYEKYAGATTITPNEGELSVVSGTSEHDRDGLTARRE